MSEDEELQAPMHARLQRQGHREQPPAGLGTPEAHRSRASAHPTPHRRGRALHASLGQLLSGINVPPLLAGAARGVAAALASVLIEVALTRAGFVPAGTWQDKVPLLVGSLRVFEGALDQWGKGTNV